MKKIYTFIIMAALSVAGCSPEEQVGKSDPSQSSGTLSSGPSIKTFDAVTVNHSDGSQYAVVASVTWLGSSTTWTYTITGLSGAKNISHVNFFGFNACFWDNISAAEGLVLEKEPSATGCFNADTQVIKYTPANDSEKKSMTFVWTFNSALGVNPAAASLYVKASTNCESVTIPGPSCDLLAIGGKVEELVCDGYLTSKVAYDGITVTATQGTESRTATTDANGDYSFSNIGGEWIIAVDGADAQSVIAGPDNGSVSFVVDNRPNNSCAAILGSASEMVCNGVISSTNLAGLTVTLNANGSVKGSTTTAADGTFKFDHVANGTYTVSFKSSSVEVTVAGEQGDYSTGTLAVDSRMNGSCASISGHADVINCVNQSKITTNHSGATVTAGAMTTTTDSNGNFTFNNVPAGTYSVIIANTSMSVTVTDSGSNTVGPYTIDMAGPICGGTTAANCSLSQGYWFAKPQAVWPNGTVTIGGKTYSQAEGKAIWNISNAKGLLNAKAAFTQAAAVKLSGSSVSPSATVWADVAIIDNYLASIAKISPTAIPGNSKTGANAAAGAAAGRIGQWIDANHCKEQ